MKWAKMGNQTKIKVAKAHLRLWCEILSGLSRILDESDYDESEYFDVVCVNRPKVLQAIGRLEYFMLFV